MEVHTWLVPSASGQIARGKTLLISAWSVKAVSEGVKESRQRFFAFICFLNYFPFFEMRFFFFSWLNSSKILAPSGVKTRGETNTGWR